MDGKWKIAAGVLGGLNVVVLAGTVFLLVFGTGGSDGKEKPAQTELQPAAVSKEEMEVASEIVIAPEGAAEAVKENESTENHRYEVISGLKTWSEAKMACEARGGYLATVTSQEEYDRIIRAADQSDRQVLWLGGRREADNNFEWITGESFAYSSWLQNEPNNEGGGENCLVTFLVNGQWVWADVPENLSAYYTEDQVGFVCEYNE